MSQMTTTQRMYDHMRGFMQSFTKLPIQPSLGSASLLQVRLRPQSTYGGGTKRGSTAVLHANASPSIKTAPKLKARTNGTQSTVDVTSASKQGMMRASQSLGVKSRYTGSPVIY